MERTGFSTSHNHILILEDDDSIAELLTWVLSEAGYEVLNASTVSEAREICRVETPEVIIADLLLPDGLGTDLLHELRQSHDGNMPPAVVMSALPQASQHAEAAGAMLCLGKPFDLTELLGAVSRFSNSSPDLVPSSNR